MAGARPSHLERRGAVYAVRFRLPLDLAAKLGVAEIRRSLQTKDGVEARARCLRATTWFVKIIEKLRHMPSPTRADLEAAAREFFLTLVEEVDRPREYDASHVDLEIGYEIEMARERSDLFDDQLRQNKFSKEVEFGAADISRLAGTEFAALPERLQLYVLQLAARAHREQAQFFIHAVTNPAADYTPSSGAFDLSPAGPRPQLLAREVPPEATAVTLREAVTDYLRRMEHRGVRSSQLEEVRRVLGWLQEVFQPEQPLGNVTRERLRTFRDDLGRRDGTLQGRHVPFRDSLTNVAENQIKSVTAIRYWNAVKSFLAWATAEQLVEVDNAAVLRLEARRGQERRTPPPLSQTEIVQFCKTPLYAGYRSLDRVMDFGECHTRGGKWWSGVVMMFTGLRAGELAQLLPADFDFDHEVPHLKVRVTDETGAAVKSVKNQASVRDVPLHPALVELGLRQFVQQRRKAYPKDRVFREFRLGSKGRASDGMTKFWNAYLRRFDLWKEGRATHVWRHTVVAALRFAEVSNEDIGAIVGHTPGTVTGAYGGEYPLTRKLKVIERLSYGFDVVKALGGPYNPKLHA